MISHTHPPYTTMQGYFSTTEAGKLLGLTKATLASWADSGRITVEREPGGHRRIPAEQVGRLAAVRKQLLAKLPSEQVDTDTMAAADAWTQRFPTSTDMIALRMFVDGYIAARRGPSATLSWNIT